MQTHKTFVLGLLYSLCLGCAWLLPSTIGSALLGWLSCFFLILAIRRGLGYREIWALGIISHLIGFFWLFFTIKDFGGFTSFQAFLIFLLFLVVSATQYLIFLFVFKNLPRFFESVKISLPLAWLCSEFISIRIFPWYLGHTQLEFRVFAQCAEIAGVSLISFLMLWVVDAAYGLHCRAIKLRAALLPFLVFGLAIFYGYSRLNLIEQIKPSTQSIAVVQANISISEKHNIKYFERNVSRYLELSKGLSSASTLIIWPETVVSDFIYSKVGSLDRDSRLPNLPSKAPMLIGALTFDSSEVYYNSALAIQSDGTVFTPYHKRILMPFGEYTPFADYLPWINSINSTAAGFTAGSEARAFNYKVDNKDILVSPLICYEDIVPEMGREAAQTGADLLVNMTNDAWFGKTVAPYQHHLIASFRAIENRRYLIRSTNSGLSAIVNATGQTSASLPIFDEGVIEHQVGLYKIKSHFSYFGDYPLKIIALFSLLAALCNSIFSRSVYCCRFSKN